MDPFFKRLDLGASCDFSAPTLHETMPQTQPRSPPVCIYRPLARYCFCSSGETATLRFDRGPGKSAPGYRLRRWHWAQSQSTAELHACVLARPRGQTVQCAGSECRLWIPVPADTHRLRVCTQHPSHLLHQPCARPRVTPPSPALPCPAAAGPETFPIAAPQAIPAISAARDSRPSRSGVYIYSRILSAHSSNGIHFSRDAAWLRASPWWEDPGSGSQAGCTPVRPRRLLLWQRCPRVCSPCWMGCELLSQLLSAPSASRGSLRAVTTLSFSLSQANSKLKRKSCMGLLPPPRAELHKAGRPEAARIS